MKERCGITPSKTRIKEELIGQSACRQIAEEAKAASLKTPRYVNVSPGYARGLKCVPLFLQCAPDVQYKQSSNIKALIITFRNDLMLRLLASRCAAGPLTSR